jgi:hypothetical protein
MNNFIPAHMQYSYCVGFFKGNKMIFQIWINNAADSISAENTARIMCNNQYNVKIIDREA